MNELKNKALSAVEGLKKAGADMSQVRISVSETREMTLEGNDFTLYRTLFDESLGITAYKDHKKGSYSTNKIDDATVEAAIKSALDSAESSQADEAYDIAPCQGELEKTEGPLEPDEELLFNRIKELKEQSKEKYPKVNVYQILAKYIHSKSVAANSNGTVAKTECGYYTIMVQFNGLDGDKTSSLDYTGFVTRDLNKPFIECGDVAIKLSNAEKQLYAESMEGKFVGTLLLDPNMVEMTTRALTYMAGGTSILEKTSIYLDKLDTKIADERITIGFASDDPKFVASSLLASGDFKAEPYNFIENGVLKNFDIDYYLEKKTGFKHAPNNGDGLFVRPGETALSDIIKNIDRGLLCGGFSGGEPGINGEFSGVAKNSFLIENGKITKAVTETMISGNFAEMINNLIDISKETISSGASELPYMAFSGITISGK